jgi:AbiV family abortive infection protein
MKVKKAAKIAEQAFLNGVRLHKDSILLLNSHSYPSAYQLSVLAQEEIGKAFLMEDYIFYKNQNNESLLEDYSKLLEVVFTSHQPKQGAFSKQADESYVRKGHYKVPKIMREASSGLMEVRKQNATYVGLTRKNRKVIFSGKILVPQKLVRPLTVKRMITRVNDFVVDLCEGFQRGIYAVETEELEEQLTLVLARELESLWPHQNMKSKRRLAKIRTFEIEPKDNY